MQTSSLTTAEKELIDYAARPDPFSIQKPQEMDKLIAAADNINAADASGKTALHHAASIGKTELVCKLVGAGADPNHPGGTSRILPAALAAHCNDASSSKHYNTFTALLRMGSHRPFDDDGTQITDLLTDHTHRVDQALLFTRLERQGFMTAHDQWYAASREAWRQWTKDTHCDVSKLTPEMLIRFHGIRTIDQVFDSYRWHGRGDHLKTLLSHPDIPPYYVEQWLHTCPSLTEMLQSPSTRVMQAELRNKNPKNQVHSY